MVVEEYLLKVQPTWVLILLWALGFLAVLKTSVSLLKWVYVYFLRPPKNLIKSYGSWAVVTGSTDGIGKSLAFQLASKGLNLVLVGRNPEKLKQVSAAIRNKTHRQIETVVMDFSKSGDHTSDGIRRLRDVIGGIDVGVLINNAGVAYPSAMYFEEVDEEMWRDILKVNVEGLTAVTQAVLPAMVERKRGAIVNIGSGSSVVSPSFPLYTIYAATKAYVDSFSRSLNVEYKDKGIDVQCQIPLFVGTKMISGIILLTRSSIFIPSPDAYALAAMRWIGYEPRCTPYWAHSLQWCLASFVPDFILNELCLKIVIRERKLKKSD